MTEQELQRKLMILESQVKEMEFKVNRADSNTSQLQSLVRGHQFMIDENKRAIYGTVGGKGISIIRGADGAMEIVGQNLAYPRPFDMESVGSDTASIKKNDADAGGVWIGGVKITTITAGTGTTWNATDGTWDLSTLSADAYVILSIDLTMDSGSQVTIQVEPSLDDGTDKAEVWPLWYLPWDSGTSTINKSGIIDLRNAVHITTF